MFRPTRRRFLKGAAAAFAAPYLISSAALGADKPADAGGKTKIILIGHKPDHPPGTHEYLHECGLLATCLRQTPGVEAVVSDRWPTDAAVLDGATAVFLYSGPGAELLLKGPHADEVERLMKRGLGLTALHWATGIGNKDDQQLADRYLALLGGLFGLASSGMDTTDARAEQVDPAHPICRGWSAFDLKDEFYLNLKFLPESKPILKVRVKDKEHTVAWAYERPGASGGRSYGNVLGHFHGLFGLEPFRRAIVNGILWTAHREVPPEGAPCKVTDQDMALKPAKA